MKILNNCAIRKAYKGFLLFCLKRSAKFVSKPILVNARANHSPCKFFKLSFTEAVVAGEIKKENKREAAINPRTNFGNRSQMTLPVGFVSATPAECLL